MAIYLVRVDAPSNAIGDICTALQGACKIISIIQEHDEEPPPGPNGSRPATFRVKVPTDELITRLCVAREDKTVSRERIAAAFARAGLSETSLNPALSKLKRSNFFNVTEKSVKLVDLAITPENVHKAITDKGIR